MSTRVWQQVRADLRRVLLGIPGIPDVRLELQKPVSPVVGVAYLLETIEKGGVTVETMGKYGTVQEDGIYKLDLKWPADGIKSDGEDLADLIRLTFYPGRAIRPVSGGDYIDGLVETSEARATIPGDAWLTFPVRINFFFRRRTRQGVIA